jgi:hypothetical protein
LVNSGRAGKRIRAGHDGDPIEAADSLCQKGDAFRVTIVRVADVASFTKQSIRLVKKENRVRALGIFEEGIEILFGFANVFPRYRVEIDTIEPEACHPRERRCHCGRRGPTD